MARADARRTRERDKDRPSEERTKKKRRKEKEKVCSRKRPRNSESGAPRKSAATRRRKDDSSDRHSSHRHRSRRCRHRHIHRKSRPRRSKRARRRSPREDRRRSRRARISSYYEYSESLATSASENDDSRSLSPSRPRQKQAPKSQKNNSQALGRAERATSRGPALAKMPKKTPGSVGGQVQKNSLAAPEEPPQGIEKTMEGCSREDAAVEVDVDGIEAQVHVPVKRAQEEEQASPEEHIGGAEEDNGEDKGEEKAEENKDEAENGEGAPTAAEVLMANRLSGRRTVTALSAGGSSGDEAAEAPCIGRVPDRRRNSVAIAAEKERGADPSAGEDAEDKLESNVLSDTNEEQSAGAAAATAPDQAAASSEDEAGSKPFAWMDSADEAGSGSEQSIVGNASGGPNASDDLPPPVAQEVETLGQMLRLAESLASRQEKLDAASLVDVCAAAARVRFYDPALFQETLGPPILRCFHEGLADGLSDRFDIDQALEVVGALSRLNAASALAHVFGAAAKALRDCGNQLSSAHRKTIKEVYASAGRERDVLFLSYLVPSGDENQLHKVKGSPAEGMNSDGLPMRPGMRICEGFFKGGTCRNGAGCRNDHPEALRLTFNSEGYPIRPWVQACTYYMRMGTCDYRKTCKWHHPEKKDRAVGSSAVFSWVPKGGSMGMGGH